MDKKEWVDAYNIMMQIVMEGEGRWQDKVPEKERQIMKRVRKARGADAFGCSLRGCDGIVVGWEDGSWQMQEHSWICFNAKRWHAIFVFHEPRGIFGISWQPFRSRRLFRIMHVNIYTHMYIH